MDWKTFVHEVILKQFSYVKSLSVTENFKNRLRLHLIDIEASLIASEQKRFFFIFDRKGTWCFADARLNIYYSEKVLGPTMRRFKSQTERKLDDHMEKIIRQIRNHCNWYLTGDVGQRSAVMQELINCAGIPK